MGQAPSVAVEKASPAAKDAARLFRGAVEVQEKLFQLQLQHAATANSDRELVPILPGLLETKTFVSIGLLPEPVEQNGVANEFAKYVDPEIAPAVEAVRQEALFRAPMLFPRGYEQADFSLLTVGPDPGGLYRIDYLRYEYGFEAKEIVDQFGQSMSAVIVVVHAVDTKKLTRSQALIAVREMYADALAAQERIKNDPNPNIIEALKKVDIKGLTLSDINTAVSNKLPAKP